METVGSPQGRDRTAIAASIAIHLCAVLALGTFPRPAFPVDDPDERLLLASTIRIEHRPPAHAALTRRSLAPRAETARPAIRPVIHTAITVEHAARRLVVAPEAPNAYAPRSRRAIPATPVAPVSPPDADPGPVTTQAAPDQVAAANPAPSPAPSAAPVATGTPSEEGIGNFGETYPASIEPALRSALRAVGTGFDVRITVDENGHATAIEFVRSPDPAVREELRAKLLAARFIPAACNGLRCAGMFELKT